MLTVGGSIHMQKLKPGGRRDYAWDGVVVRCDSDGVVLRAEFNVDLVERHFATFRRGDIFFEFYYWDRPYNIFQISQPDGALKGWYCNLGLPPEVEEGFNRMSYVDLALDVWANPDGSFVVLDEDELEAILAEYPEHAENAERGRAELVRLAQLRQLPRWPGFA